MKVLKAVLVVLLYLFASGCGAASDDDGSYLPPVKPPPSVPVSCPGSSLAFLESACPSKLICEYLHQRCWCVGDVPKCGVVS